MGRPRSALGEGRPLGLEELGGEQLELRLRCRYSDNRMQKQRLSKPIGLGIATFVDVRAPSPPKWPNQS